MLAGLCKAPEIALDEADSKRIAIAVVNVGRHYNLAVAEKTMDWANLIMCLGMVYGGKFMAITLRVKAEKDAARAARTPEPEENGSDNMFGMVPVTASYSGYNSAGNLI